MNPLLQFITFDQKTLLMMDDPSVLPFPILYEDNHLLIVWKPPDLPTMGVRDDRPTLLSITKQYIKAKYDKPGKVYLGIVSRLDAPVTGALVIARTSKAASRLTNIFRRREIEKIYWALVEQPLDPPQGKCVDWVRKDERNRKMHITRPETEGAKIAKLSYQSLRGAKGAQLVEVQLETGRKHQIRLQLAKRGSPIIGDRKYGGKPVFPEGIALHCRRLCFEHPVRRIPLEITAPLPACWRKYGLLDEA